MQGGSLSARPVHSSRLRRLHLLEALPDRPECLNFISASRPRPNTFRAQTGALICGASLFFFSLS